MFVFAGRSTSAAASRAIALKPSRALALPALLTLALLAGCAQMPTAGDNGVAAATSSAARAYQPSINIAGRLSLRYQQNGADQAMHGSFTWDQQPQHTVLTMLSPLGQTVAVIDINNQRAMLTQSGRAPRTAADVDALTAQALGWPLPVSGLRDWLQGFGTDAQGRKFVASPAAGDTTVTTADGWKIVYSTWETSNGAPFPRRIDLTRETERAGPVAIRIAIDSAQAR